jgi:serine/threonine-protein kinase
MLVGRYRVERLLGRGGMGAVYVATDTALGRSVALKVVAFDPRLDDSAARDARMRLVREARAAASLSHPNVVTLHDVGEHEGMPFLAMELVPGASLRERMGAPATVEEKLGWLRDIARALAAAHDSAIVHRDVKPENVIVQPDGHAKVLDFGIARRPAAVVDVNAPTAAPDDALGTLTHAGALVGTPRYMAPEQLRGEAVDARTDQFAWGVLAYELFSGQLPWGGADGVALIANVLDTPARPLAAVDAPPALAAVVARALKKAPADRFASMGAALAALEGGLVVAAARQPTVSTRPRRRLLWLGAAAVALMAGAVAVASARLGAGGAPQGRGVAVTEIPLPTSSVPSAVSEYHAGLQAFRDGDLHASRGHFHAAHELDPTMGAAWLRDWTFLIGTPGEHADLLRKALDLRAGMPQHEAELLDAVAPCGLGRGSAVGFCVDALRAVAARHPNDAETQHWIACQESFAGHMRASKEAAKRALELDPKFGMAWAPLLSAEAYLGEEDALERDARACVNTTASLSCLANRAALEAELGMADALEATAHEMLGIDPKSYDGFTSIAAAEWCSSASEATVRHATDQMIANATAEPREDERRRDDAWFAWMRGDFDAVLAYQVGQESYLAAATDVHRIAFAADYHMRALVEVGRRDDALAVGRRYLERRPTLVTDSLLVDTDSNLGDEGLGMILRDLREAGMDRAEVRKIRDAYVASWRARLGPDFLPFLWTVAYLEPAVDADDAKEALAEMPKFGAPMKRWDTEPVNGGGEGLLGHAYLLAGRVEEAVPWLERGARACVEPFSLLPMMSRLWLGEAREQQGNQGAACDAYAHVLQRWGHASPRSVTADEARRRSDALGCR